MKTAWKHCYDPVREEPLEHAVLVPELSTHLGSPDAHCAVCPNCGRFFDLPGYESIEYHTAMNLPYRVCYDCSLMERYRISRLDDEPW